MRVGAKNDHKEEQEERRETPVSESLTPPWSFSGGFRQRKTASWCSPEPRLLRAQKKSWKPPQQAHLLPSHSHQLSSTCSF